MNWFWGFWFKDKFRTPFSVYTLSLAELIVLCGMMFGVGFGRTKGVQKVIDMGASFKGSPEVVTESEAPATSAASE